MRIPDRDTFTAYIRHYLMLLVAFALVYGVTNYWASLQSEHYSLYFSIERRIPFVPQAILAYLSICVLFVLPMLYIDKPRIVALARAFMFTLLVAGVCFVVIPAETAHSRPATVSFLPVLFELLYTFELPHNLVPSLHIAYTVLFLSVCGALESRRVLVWVYFVWGGLLFASVLLLHQHQLIDVLSGAMLGWIAYRGVYVRSVR